MNNRKIKILVIDDQDGMRRSLAILLKKEGFLIKEAVNGCSAIPHLKNEHFDIVITDLKMSLGTGLDVLYYVKEKHPLTDVIIMTGYGTVDSAVLAMKLNAFDYISKPFKPDEILHRVRKSINHIEDRTELTRLNGENEREKRFIPIIGNSQTIKELIALIEKIAKVDLPVLITGDTGTGKNLVAKAIHSLSSRAAKPLVSINCASVPEYLLESELFGHAKGAFTGAYLDRKGLFEEADDGSLLLDEIGSMPYTMQAKLLDFLQELIIRQVGSNKMKKVNVRIMSATNTDLEENIKDGTFRDDLFYRIKVTHIHIPPLREYIEDIPSLARHFLDLYKKEFNKSDLQLSSDAIDFMCQYDYPGNVRELKNIISSAAAISTGPYITTQDLSLSFTNRFFDFASESKVAKPGTFQESEKNLIMNSIKKHSQNLAKVCDELGIGRTTLWRKMKKYNIDSTI
jgi:DNA-binding NtrC family response regulator